ncbi:PrsW family intramembrane metalloprotease [Streptomyces antarcticus]|uniref:PrsW family intramembrane metalloprotease n=1 Tax=Streptomyces antarcticus TaxID=2996458 RepID=UPI002270C76C|nr:MULTISPECIES: PrsW family intramembrane metalloprotease [unclassified Streptomyces]MCY0944737.1 PrsW family intramembrane metalloprotease [Streptomyces sp. H34-AA3]MCZ4087762.1 PrsW family intramembrane metalloprotease [Streptomyces sp. H34-S5]
MFRALPRVLARPSGAVRTSVLVVLLAVTGISILELVREQTGTRGFLVGLGLALVPVPPLLAAFRWLGRAAPAPRPQLLFCFGWGACTAALIAILANSFATQWIAAATADPSDADQLGSVAIAPVVEESAKAAALLLVFVFRRRHFTGPADGFVVAGFTATGFAFTENILYLGNAFDEDLAHGTPVLDSVTAATFFVRVVLSPFAHPLFTVLTGLGFGAAALASRRASRVVLPLLGLASAMGLHALWNGSSRFGEYGFYVIYGCVMAPVFGLLVWLAVRIRRRRLRAVAGELAVYAAAGWLAPAEVPALASMPARALARSLARRSGGRAAGRAVARYEADAAALALLRNRARRGGPPGHADFAGRERELLHRLWQCRATAGPALARAALMEELLPPSYDAAHRPGPTAAAGTPARAGVTGVPGGAGVPGTTGGAGVPGPRPPFTEGRTRPVPGP